MPEFGDSRQLGGSVQMVGKGNEWQSLWPNRVGALPSIDQESLKEGQGGLWEKFWVSGTPGTTVAQWPAGGVYSVCRREKGHSERIKKLKYQVLSGLGNRGEMILWARARRDQKPLPS